MTKIYAKIFFTYKDCSIIEQKSCVTKGENLMKNRNIALCILFTIITCGIYGIYWFICMTNEMNETVPDDKYQTSGGMAFLFTIITCGIYGFYWNYCMGQKMDKEKDGNNAILFLILSILGLGIINLCIMQGFINEHVEV